MYCAWPAVGGQDSVAFGLLGARVTVFDLSDVQFERDHQAAVHHGLQIITIQGDMRDLSIFSRDCFDLVWQAYSINFVSSVEPVFAEVARVLKPVGFYFLQFANPFVQTVDDEAWDGKAYHLKDPYVDGEDLTMIFPNWDFLQPDGKITQLPGPHEYRHTMGRVINSMVFNNFSLLGLWEWMREDIDPESGSWAHFTQAAPPWFDSFWRLNI
jgi:ubiquinone/menaquinone biosynthesis C-methylase UbiE